MINFIEQCFLSIRIAKNIDKFQHLLKKKKQEINSSPINMIKISKHDRKSECQIRIIEIVFTIQV